ncbi:methyltransferase domain-containing protein [Cohnella sp. AR92]|uniref:methyltransferase domain-containing protein n=1 Tax=Cohnella sp. AR92 TaxID=648716 RepID=UPI0013155433|nr:methyltransferase domain-containing protein [Cohnella sp. AR92]
MYPKIVFIAMAGRTIGMGHATRLKVLRDKAVRLGLNSVSLYAVAPMEDIHIEGFDKQYSTFEQLEADLKKESPIVAVVDGPIERLNREAMIEMRHTGVTICLINDADEPIDPETYDYSISCSVKYADQSKQTGTRLFGPKFIILSDQYVPAYVYKKNISEHVQRLLLSFGGTDPGKITPIALELLNKCSCLVNKLSIEIILGAHADINEKELQSRHQVSIYRGVNNMSERLRHADVAIISGGMTLYEASCVGVPIVTINQNQEQEDEAAAFENLNAIVNLGIHNQLTNAHFDEAMQRMMEPEFRRSLSRTASRLIDARGSERIVQLIQSIVERGTHPMYIDDNHTKWEKLHHSARFRLIYPSETTIRFIKGNFNQGEGHRILDLGCGTGRHVVFLASEGYDVTGIDFSKEGLHYTAQRLEQLNLSAELVQGSIVTLPFENESFDGVISISVIYYFIKADVQRVIDELYRVLKPGGKAFIVVRALDDKRYGQGIEVEPNTYVMDNDFSNEEKMTIHFFSVEEVREMFVGFNEISIGFHREGYSSLADVDSDLLITITK